MSIITARNTFIETVLTKNATCNACHGDLFKGMTVLTKDYPNPNNRAQTAKVILCNDDCWQTFDHNFWVSRPLKKATDKFIGEVRKYEFKTESFSSRMRELNILERQSGLPEIEAETERLKIQ